MGLRKSVEMNWWRSGIVKIGGDELVEKWDCVEICGNVVSSMTTGALTALHQVPTRFYLFNKSQEVLKNIT